MKHQEIRTANPKHHSGPDFMGRNGGEKAKLARRAIRRRRRAVVGGLFGIAILSAVAVAGSDAVGILHLTVPGPVIGLAFLAVVFLFMKRFHARIHRRLTLHVTPTGRALISHMGLLFVPAGAGIIAEGNALRQAWLPLITGVVGSTVIGLLATGWVMHRFAPKNKN